MKKFEKRKREVLQPIYFEAGAALADCQAFEFGIVYLLDLFARFGAEGLDTKNTASILDNEEKKTLGQLIGLLKKHLKVSKNLEDSLSKALKARNKLIHRYFVENIERIADPSKHEKIVKEIRLLRSQVRKSHQQLDPFVKALAKMLDGISIEGFTSAGHVKYFL